MKISDKTKYFLTFAFKGAALGLALVGGTTMYNNLNTNASIPLAQPETITSSAPASQTETKQLISPQAQNVLDLVAHLHVNKKKANDQDARDTDAINGVLQMLDPHSRYVRPEAYRQMRTEESGRIATGIGVEVAPGKEALTVVNCLKGYPAERAGIQPGDQITHVGGELVASLGSVGAVKKIHDAPGTSITLTILPKNAKKPIDITIVREEIRTLPVKSFIVGKTIGYVKLDNFEYEKTDSNGVVLLNKDGSPMETGASLVRDAVLTMKKEMGPDAKGYILDLRGNTGGDMDQAIRLVSQFIKAGKTVVESRGRTPQFNQSYKTNGNDDIVGDKPIVILTNHLTASASEITVAAMKDYGRAITIGTQTFGKGSVQALIEIKDGIPQRDRCLPTDNCSALLVTTALHYAPKGYTVQGQGMPPDILVPLGNEQEIKFKEANMAHTINQGDQDVENPHKTSATCSPTSDVLAEKFEKALIGPDGNVDGTLLCAVAQLDKKSKYGKYTTVTPYKTGIQILSQ